MSAHVNSACIRAVSEELFGIFATESSQDFHVLVKLIVCTIEAWDEHTVLHAVHQDEGCGNLPSD